MPWNRRSTRNHPRALAHLLLESATQPTSSPRVACRPRMEITTRRPGSPGSPSFTTYLPYEVSHRRPVSPAASSSLGYSSSTGSLDEYRLGWNKRDAWLSKDEWRAHRGVQLSCLSPTMSTVIKTRSPSPTRSRSSSRPSTPTFWRSDEPPPYEIDRSRPAVPLTWKPSGSHRFPVAWLDSSCATSQVQLANRQCR